MRNKIAEQHALIHEKDSQIGEKENTIYTLKKKTQELEKFKFVLDYKIKELKDEIAPREEEIQRLKVKTNEMDNQLWTFNVVNSQLGFTVSDLRTRQDQMTEMITRNRHRIRKNELYIQRFKNTVYQVV